MKLFKNTKKIFALVLATAIVAMSMFTGIVVSAETSTVKTWNGSAVTEVTLADSSAPNSSTNPYIISEPGQLFAMTRCLCTYNGNVIDTDGAYFKVADGIDAFYMNGGETVANLNSAADVKAWFEDSSNSKSQWWANGKFKGSFDGNGITIYGLYCTQASAGLFPKVDGITIKNTTIKNSYFAARNYDGAAASGEVGAFIGDVEWVSGDVYGDITLEQLASINNYIESSSKSSTNGPGAIAGNLRAAKYNINNCIVYGNEMNNMTSSTNTGIVAYGGNKNSNAELGSVTNVIAIDVAPYTKGGGWYCHAADSGVFKNIYTTADVTVMGSYSASVATKYNLNTMSAEQMKGIAAKNNMSALDWENIWCYGAEGRYPSIALVDSSESDETKLTSSFGGYDDDFITDEGVGSGTKTDPYIISTAGQLASVCAARIKDANGSTVSTTGLYFKVADNLTAFYMNGGETVANLTSAAEVKTYFEANGGSTWWSSSAFNGYFDGNGATVYGIYCPVAQANSALFHSVGTAATIKNISVKNSYFASPQSGYAGGIVAVTSTNSGTLTIENCTVANNYIHSAYSGNNYYGGAGAIVGNNFWGPTITVNNCLVYGNDIGNDYADTLTTPGLFGFAVKGTVSNTIAIGVNPFIIADTSNGQFNSISKSALAENFTNVYTDADISVAATLYSQDYSGHITQLTTAQMQGAKAKINMPSLAWDSDWYVGNRGEYPSLTPVETSYMSADLQAEYDAMTLSNPDNYGDSTANFGMYATSLNLKANPYMAFTFAFNGEYKQSNSVVATFKSGDETIATVKASEMTNNEGAGRYHLYRLEDAPVIALCTGISVTVNGTDFGTFSAEGFALEAYRANRINPCDYYATRYEAAKALLFYAQMLDVRYGA